jgi:hypothetical protein
MDQHKEKPMANGTRNLADEDLTRAVLASFAHSKSERFREVVQSLVRHLHAFVREVQLTKEEWRDDQHADAEASQKGVNVLHFDEFKNFCNTARRGSVTPSGALESSPRVPAPFKKEREG